MKRSLLIVQTLGAQALRQVHIHETLKQVHASAHVMIVVLCYHIHQMAALGLIKAAIIRAQSALDFLVPMFNMIINTDTVYQQLNHPG